MSESKRPTFWQRVRCWWRCGHTPKWSLSRKLQQPMSKPDDADGLCGLPDWRCARCGHEW